LVQLSRIGVSREGRDVQVLTLNDAASGPADEKPAYLIHGNIHAAELSGTHAALYTARQLVLDHRDQRSDLLRHVCFHIIPRLNPDGAGFVVSTSGNTRSRTDRSLRLPNTLYQQDVDGNGLILEMRAIAEFIHGRPNLFAVLGYHTGPTAVLRPPSTGADADIDGGDLAMMQELAELGPPRRASRSSRSSATTTTGPARRTSTCAGTSTTSATTISASTSSSSSSGPR